MIKIDRFEGEYAVCEIAGTMVDIPKSELPDGAVEGSVLSLSIVETDDRERIAKKQNSLFKN